jgi:hypothetical protein
MRCFSRLLFGAFALFSGASSFCADKGAPLIVHPDPVAFPGVGRVIFGFVFTVALAVTVTYAFRRWMPRFAAGKNAASSQIDLTSHCIVRNGMRFHVVTIAGNTVLVAEGKSGIAITVVSEAEKRAEASTAEKTMELSRDTSK